MQTSSYSHQTSSFHSTRPLESHLRNCLFQIVATLVRVSAKSFLGTTISASMTLASFVMFWANIGDDKVFQWVIGFFLSLTKSY